MFNETNRHHPEVLLALSRAFSAKGMRVMLFIIEHSDELEGVVDNVLSYQLDGVIAAAPIPTADLATLEQAEVPVIFYNRPGTLRCASVSCDHAAAGRSIAAHLFERGHRSFALVNAKESFVAAERMRGVKEELELAGAQVVAETDGDFSYAEGFAAVEAWLAEGLDSFTALIAANDLMAIGAHDALIATKRQAMEEVVIAGFDGVDASRWQSHRIASVRQPIEQMAEAVAEMMIKRLEDDTVMAEYRLFPGQLQPATWPETGGAQ